MHRIIRIVPAVLVTLAVNAQAQTPRYLEDLVDARASAGEQELERRGFRHHDTIKSRGNTIGYWWNARERQCVAVTTRNGRFSSIASQSESMCGNGQGGSHTSGGRSPFTSAEAREMSTVWGSIRKAARYEDINWRSVGLSEAPGSYQSRELMSKNWGKLRQARRFEDIDWASIPGYSDSSHRHPGHGSNAGTGPFTHREAADMAAIWGSIRGARRYEDINWRSVGLSAAPGSYEARSLMSTHWGRLRQARRFEEIDWASITGSGGSSDRYPESGWHPGTGPFTQREAEDMAAIWGSIRKAARYEDINWRSVGLSSAPGSYEARRAMSANWGRLRQARRFEDIDWQSIR